mmetsp:Transcript_139258/g.353067  ORF Transcript_139258/g.353067 Transcript_139258/m.353067 type:complete len:299 (-) Transcript_139258:3120-4016(-)
MVLAVSLAALHLPDLPSIRQQVRWGQDRVEVEHAVADRRVGSQSLGASDRIVQGPETELRHQHAHLLGHEHQVVHHVLRHTFEFLAEDWVLGCNADWASIQVALAHHDATQGDERRRGHRNLLCPKQSGHDDIAPGSDLAVSLHSHSVPQPVQHERLVGLSDADLPRQATMLDGSPLGSTSAPGHARDREVVGLALCDTRGDDADADPCDELHGDTCGWVCVFQVTDQLCHIFDGIHVMMRRRRDETHTRRGLPGLSDFPDDLVARELSTLARLCPLRQLNLDLIGIGEVFCRYPETP